MSEKEITLEPRNCAACGSPFMAMLTSPQAHCSDVCQRSGEKWDGARRRGSRGEEKRRRVVIVNDTPPTPRSEKPRWHGSDSSMKGKPSSLASKSKIETAASEARKQFSKPGRSTTEEDPTSDGRKENVNTTEETKSALPTVSSNQSAAATPPMVLPPQSENLSEETSHSTSLLRDTGKHLFSLMTGLTPKTEEGQEPRPQLLDPDRVRAAAECGKQIIATMRVQLDILKFKKELRDQTEDAK